MLRGKNQSLASEVENLNGALHVAQSKTQVVQNQSRALIASLSIKSPSAVDEI